MSIRALILLTLIPLAACERQESFREEAREAGNALDDGWDAATEEAGEAVQAIGRNRTPAQKAIDERVRAIEGWIERHGQALDDAGDAAADATRKTAEQIQADLAGVQADLDHLADKTGEDLKKAQTEIQERLDAIEARIDD